MTLGEIYNQIGNKAKEFIKEDWSSLIIDITRDKGYVGFKGYYYNSLLRWKSYLIDYQFITEKEVKL